MDLNVIDRIKEIVTYIDNIDLIIKEYKYFDSLVGNTVQAQNEALITSGWTLNIPVPNKQWRYVHDGDICEVGEDIAAAIDLN